LLLEIFLSFLNSFAYLWIQAHPGGISLMVADSWMQCSITMHQNRQSKIAAGMENRFMGNS
jgi:hypothetical protein